MRKSKIILVILSMYISLYAVAQSNIWLTGNIYNEDAGKQITIPFATVSIYDYNNPNELRYFTVCGPHGNYSIKPYDHTKKYSIVVEAPGYKTQKVNLKEIPEIWDGKPFSGNCNVCIPLEKDNKISTDIKIKNYTAEELKKGTKAQTITDLLYSMPEIRKEGNDWVTVQGEGSICIFLNGIKATPTTLAKFDKKPAESVTSIEYYQLPEGGIYDATVNITLIVGKPATAPTYKLKPSRFIF